MRRKTLTLMLVLLATFAIVGVGYAAWVITKNANATLDTEEQPQITTYGVTDERLTAELSWVGLPEGKTSPEFIFGIADTSAEGYTEPTNSWLSATSEVLTESLEAKLTIKIFASDELLDATKLDWSVVFTVLSGDDDATTENYEEAMTKEYITGPAVTTTLDSETTSADGLSVSEFTKVGDHLEATLTITLNWGEATNGQNPYVYFNNQTLEDASDDAFAMLDFISKLNGLKFNVTVTAQPK